MTSPVKVIIPWRPEPTRQAGLDWLVRYYSHRFGTDAVHIETDDTDGPFNKCRLINRAARGPRLRDHGRGRVHL